MIADGRQTAAQRQEPDIRLRKQDIELLIKSRPQADSFGAEEAMPILSSSQAASQPGAPQMRTMQEVAADV